MNLKPIKIVPMKSLNINNLDDIVGGAFENTGLSPDIIAEVVGKIKKR